jgi:opacity protein-like surface antigen
MSIKKVSIYLLFIVVFPLLSISATSARDLSDLKMSFSEPKVSLLPEQIPPELQPKQQIIKPITSDENRQNGWYWSTTRGANFAKMSTTAPTGEVANWNGIDSFGSVLSLANLNVTAGYKSSNWRLEGEVLVANNSMTIDRKSTTDNIIGDPDPDNPGSTIPILSGVTVNCRATTFSTMINAYYDIKTGSQFSPFVGVGIGYATTLLKDGLVDWGAGSGVIYQLKAGIGYEFNDRQNIYIQYKLSNPPAEYSYKDTQQFYSTIFRASNIEFGTRIKF